MSDWTKRGYVHEWDEDAVAYLWIADQCRSRAAVQRGAHERGTDAQHAYWREVSPLVTWMLGHTSIEVICDPERSKPTDAGPPVIWAFAATDGNLVHGCVVKREAIKLGFGGEILRDLLGERLDQMCVYTTDLVQLGPRGSKELREQLLGADASSAMPRRWIPDFFWLARHMTREAA